MRTSIFLLLILTAGSLSSPAQSLPDKGSVAGNVYTNKTLGLTWEFPANWQVQNNPANTTAYEQVLLQLYPSGAASGESVVLSCVNSNIFDEDAVPWFDDKIWKSLRVQPAFTLANGIPTHRYDFQSTQEPLRFLTSISGPRHDYGVKIILIANSLDDMEGMIKALGAMKGKPDWPSSAPAIAFEEEGTSTLPRRTLSTVIPPQGPVYPKEALKKHLQGTVVLLAHVDDSGSVRNLYVEHGNEILVPAALEAVSHWRYLRVLVDGAPSVSEIPISIRFHIDKSYDNPPTCRGSLQDCLKGTQQ